MFSFFFFLLRNNVEWIVLDKDKDKDKDVAKCSYSLRVKIGASQGSIVGQLTGTEKRAPKILFASVPDPLET